MSELLSYDTFKTFIDCQLSPSKRMVSRKIRPMLTISREAGAGGTSISQHLADLFNQQVKAENQKWTVFDRGLAEEVMKDHGMSDRISKFVTESNRGMITSAVEELLGLHPSDWTLAEHTAETILKLAHLGHVIIIGRGANLICRDVPHAFHVRIVGSLEFRVKHIMKIQHIREKTARRLIQKFDTERRAYVRKFFGEDIDNPALYHLVINTDLMDFDEVAEMIKNWLEYHIRHTRPDAEME